MMNTVHSFEEQLNQQCNPVPKTLGQDLTQYQSLPPNSKLRTDARKKQSCNHLLLLSTQHKEPYQTFISANRTTDKITHITKHKKIRKKLKESKKILRNLNKIKKKHLLQQKFYTHVMDNQTNNHDFCCCI